MGLLNDIMNDNLPKEDSLEGDGGDIRIRVGNRVSTTSFAGKKEAN